MRLDKRTYLLRALFRDYGGPLIAITALAVALSFTTGGLFLSSNNLSTLLNLFTTNCILAFAITCVLIVGEIDLSVGSIVAFSGVQLCLLLNRGVSFPVAVLIVLASGAVLGLIVGVVVSYTDMPSFIVSLAMQMILRGSANLISGGNRISSSNETLYQLSAYRIYGIPVSTIITIVVCVLLSILLSRTVFGAHMYATGGNRLAAFFSGIKTKKVVIISFILTEALASFAGILVASKVSSGQPTAGNGYEGNAIAAAVLGGVAFTGGSGTMFGALLGAFLIGILNNGMNLLEINNFWQSVCKGVIILLAVYIDTVKRKKSAA